MAQCSVSFLLAAKDTESPKDVEVKSEDSETPSEEADVWQKVKNFVG